LSLLLGLLARLSLSPLFGAVDDVVVELGAVVGQVDIPRLNVGDELGLTLELLGSRLTPLTVDRGLCGFDFDFFAGSVDDKVRFIEPIGLAGRLRPQLVGLSLLSALPALLGETGFTRERLAVDIGLKVAGADELSVGSGLLAKLLFGPLLAARREAKPNARLSARQSDVLLFNS
jgi:hypothetical protein